MEIHKRWLNLKELAERWEVTIEDLIHFAEQGKIIVGVRYDHFARFYNIQNGRFRNMFKPIISKPEPYFDWLREGRPYFSIDYTKANDLNEPAHFRNPIPKFNLEKCKFLFLGVRELSQIAAIGHTKITGGFIESHYAEFNFGLTKYLYLIPARKFKVDYKNIVISIEEIEYLETLKKSQHVHSILQIESESKRSEQTEIESLKRTLSLTLYVMMKSKSKYQKSGHNLNTSAVVNDLIAHFFNTQCPRGFGKTTLTNSIDDAVSKYFDIIQEHTEK